MRKKAARPINSFRWDPTVNRTLTMTSASTQKTRAAGPLPPRTNNPGRGGLASRPGPRPNMAGQAFTLVELLLALALMLVLVSAVVFSFSTLLNGTRLEEGTGQVESLIRFARAHAAN